MPNHSTAADFEELRAEPRHQVTLHKILIQCAIFGEHGDILNIARLGFLARTRLPRQTGTTVELHLPELGIVTADVVWCSNGLLGGRFHEAIDEDRFAAFLEQHAL